MQFSAMTMNMFFPNTDDPGDDNRIIDMAVAQSIWLAELGYHVWFTDHHFRGPWHSNPMQFAAYVAPLNVAPNHHVHSEPGRTHQGYRAKALQDPELHS